MDCGVESHVHNPVNIIEPSFIMQCLKFDVHFYVSRSYYRFSLINQYERMKFQFLQNGTCSPNSFKMAMYIKNLIDGSYQVMYHDIEEDISIWSPYQNASRFRKDVSWYIVTFVIYRPSVEKFCNEKLVFSQIAQEFAGIAELHTTLVSHHIKVLQNGRTKHLIPQDKCGYESMNRTEVSQMCKMFNGSLLFSPSKGELERLSQYLHQHMHGLPVVVFTDLTSQEEVKTFFLYYSSLFLTSV